MKHILIVEDDVSIAKVEKRYLEMAGFKVTLEYTGIDGLKRALTEDFDFIILDLMLPGVDGFQIIERIREKKNIPVMMISAREEDFIKMRAFELGLDDYLTKPFSPNELVARVKGRLSRFESLVGSSNNNKQVIEDRGVIADQKSRRAFVNDKEVVMTNKEYDILLLFMTNPNIVFSKEQIFERIWGLNSEGDMSTVTVHIRRIREKLEFDPSKPKRITTVWGIGYIYNK
ncbi:MAG: response regulator transcription factor [Firmicutes bacterium]|nr:response regulator transcription factor [Bacillota bacterium]